MDLQYLRQKYDQMRDSELLNAVFQDAPDLRREALETLRELLEARLGDLGALVERYAYNQGAVLATVGPVNRVDLGSDLLFGSRRAEGDLLLCERGIGLISRQIHEHAWFFNPLILDVETNTKVAPAAGLPCTLLGEYLQGCRWWASGEVDHVQLNGHKFVIEATAGVHGWLSPGHDEAFQSWATQTGHTVLGHAPSQPESLWSRLFKR